MKNEQANDNQTAVNQTSKRKLLSNQKSDFGKQTWRHYWYFFHFVGSKYSSLYFASEVPFALPRAFNTKQRRMQGFPAQAHRICAYLRLSRWRWRNYVIESVLKLRHRGQRPQITKNIGDTSRDFCELIQGGKNYKLLSLSHGKISQDGHCARRTGERTRRKLSCKQSADRLHSHSEQLQCY